MGEKGEAGSLQDSPVLQCRCSTNLSTKPLVGRVLDSQLWEAPIVLGEPSVSLSGRCFLEVKQRWHRHQGSKKVAEDRKRRRRKENARQRSSTTAVSIHLLLCLSTSLLLSFPRLPSVHHRHRSHHHHQSHYHCYR